MIVVNSYSTSPEEFMSRLKEQQEKKEIKKNPQEGRAFSSLGEAKNDFTMKPIFTKEKVKCNLGND